MDTVEAAVELYGLEPEQFTAARNQFAMSARAAGAERTASAIMALRKPTITAWLVNQLVRTDPDGIHALTELGEELRQTYLSADAARRRELTRLRHELVSGLVRTARERAAGGRRVSAQTAERLIETLDAALVDSGAAQLLRTGQLTSGLRHVGFGIVDESGDPAQLAAVRPRVVRRSNPPDRAESRRITSRPGRTAERRTTVDRTLQDRRNAQRKRVDQAEEDYAAAEAEREQAERVLDAHQHRTADLEADLVRLNDQLEQTRETLRQVRKQTSRLQSAFNQAARNAAAIKKRRDTENQRLNKLDG
ncbi:hypothetical protein EV137_2749 [Kribbella pratensis]|uniref:Transposase n=1 Tax=Kribbella pratensis TaxID=2512112 RepID=A0ABY2FRK2_9ACTN|nr:hypothetical protein [Kribbella pratensis]TDW95409.1 hypothetical protein EV137_2749 [Kribbella pratensis]